MLVLHGVESEFFGVWVLTQSQTENLPQRTGLLQALYSKNVIEFLMVQ